MGWSNDNIHGDDISLCVEKVCAYARCYYHFLYTILERNKIWYEELDTHPYVLSINELDFDVNEIFAGKDKIQLSLPDSFGMEPKDMYIPSTSKDDDCRFVAETKFLYPHRDGSFYLSGETLFLKQDDVLPEKYQLIGDICFISHLRAVAILMSIGNFVEYYFTAVEPLLNRHILPPTLEGRNAYFYPMSFTIGNRTVPDLTAVGDRDLIENYLQYYRDFHVAMHGLRREAVRRGGKAEATEANGNTKRLRTSRLFFNTMKDVVIDLSRRSDFDGKALTVFEEMVGREKMLNSKYWSSDIANCKSVLKEQCGFTFIGNSCRLTPETLAQIGKNFQK